MISFRTEVLKAEHLVHRSNIARESCITYSSVQSSVIGRNIRIKSSQDLFENKKSNGYQEEILK